ncbi:MAG: HD domain-containing protein [Pyrinomonadaceae bacterium]
MSHLATFTRAAYFSAKRHRRQKRKGGEGSPYINHPLEVVNLLTNIGKIEDFTVLIAALLHDTVEDTETTAAEIAEHFGQEISSIVMEVTDDKSLPKAERKQLQIEHAPHLSSQAKLVKLADKISNIRDVIENPPDGWPLERRIQYVEWGKKVVAGLRGVNEDLEKHFDELTVRAATAFSTSA